jgi:phosphoserine phosphatase RsbU/P
MIVRAVIVDDEPPARARLRHLLAEAGDVLVVAEAGDAHEARAAIADTRPDIVFLDIEMPQVSGTALAASLPEPRPFIVFATAFDRYALDAFAVNATDYLVKPITRARLGGTLARVRERLSRRSDLERDLADASAVQTRLLPRTLPSIHGYDAAAYTVPARGVGGDFYVGQRLSPARVVLALGDVSGKGMSAGLVASSVQARIESVARHRTGAADVIVEDVNRALCATSGPERFATLIYLDIDAADGQVSVVNAGHPAAVLVTPQGTHRLVSSTGPALGLFPEAPFAAQSLTLGPGDALVLYSDGVTEAANGDDEEFGEAGLLHVLAGCGHQAAAVMCRSILDAVQAHAHGVAAADDVTVMVIKRAADERTSA